MAQIDLEPSRAYTIISYSMKSPTFEYIHRLNCTLNIGLDNLFSMVLIYFSISPATPDEMICPPSFPKSAFSPCPLPPYT